MVFLTCGGIQLDPRFHDPLKRQETQNSGVDAAPGVDFGQAGKRAVMFSYASSEENIREAARRLAEYLAKR
jgi:aspartate/methionine/tyrosine aminotransferase